MVQVPDKHFDSLQGMVSIYSLWCFAPQGINTYDPLQTVKGVYLGLNHVIFVVWQQWDSNPRSTDHECRALTIRPRVPVNIYVKLIHLAVLINNMFKNVEDFLASTDKVFKLVAISLLMGLDDHKKISLICHIYALGIVYTTQHNMIQT